MPIKVTTVPNVTYDIEAWRVDGKIHWSKDCHYTALCHATIALAKRRDITRAEARRLINEDKVEYDHGWIAEGLFYTDEEWSIYEG